MIARPCQKQNIHGVRLVVSDAVFPARGDAPRTGHSISWVPLVPSIPPSSAAQVQAPLRGSVSIPGGTSMAQHALVLATLAVGRTRIRGVPDCSEIRAVAAVLRELGATILVQEDGVWVVDGVGVGGLREPDTVLDLGCAASAIPLLLGMLATHPITAIVTGDATLRCQRVNSFAHPLSLFGASFISREGDFLPLAVRGSLHPLPIDDRAPDASVKTAMLLAALNTPGRSSVIEAQPSGDRFENLLRCFGVTLDIEELGDGSRRSSLDGQSELSPADLDLLDDPSVAADSPGLGANH